MKVIAGNERQPFAAVKRLWLLVLLWALISGCRGGSAEGSHAVATGGVAARGEVVLETAGCGSCHSIPGVRGAKGRVAPPLDFFGERSFIAGRVPNTQENLIRWVLDPKSVDPKTAMPDVGLTPQQARDVAAYLYTLR